MLSTNTPPPRPTSPSTSTTSARAQNGRHKPLPTPPSSLPAKAQSPRPRRVLGTATALKPPAPPSKLSPAHRAISASPVPSEFSTTSTSNDPLVCPICTDEMLTLLQLNRHLDDFHASIPPPEKDDITSWFRSRIQRAKTFQPVAVLNQKLKGLDVFESNEPAPPPTSASPPPDHHVTRSHWKRPGEVCASCSVAVGTVNGVVNCRKCGEVFCESCTMFQMKLSRSAEHEPVRGVWCRVCESCYTSRPGYLDTTGLSRDLTTPFLTLRRRTTDRVFLERSRLEKRLTKLTTALTAAPPTALFSAARTRETERAIVPWQADADVPACPHCTAPFTPLTTRKHHCRLCGHIICAAPSCSTIVPLNTRTTPLKLRMCVTCTHTLFSHAEFARDVTTPHPSTKLYTHLCTYRAALVGLRARFAIALEKRDWGEVERVRRRIGDAVQGAEGCIKRFRSEGGEERLVRAVVGEAERWVRESVLAVRAGEVVVETARMEVVRQKRAVLGQKAVNKDAEKAAREREGVLEVLEEQRGQLVQMLGEAGRKLDEVAALRGSIDEITDEIDRLKALE